MMETYEVVWGTGIDDEGFTELVTERIDAETTDEAVLLFPLTPDIPDGELRVYKTYTNDAGAVRRGNLIREYVPDDYGYTWVPAMKIWIIPWPWDYHGQSEILVQADTAEDALQRAIEYAHSAQCARDAVIAGVGPWDQDNWTILPSMEPREWTGDDLYVNWGCDD